METQLDWPVAMLRYTLPLNFSDQTIQMPEHAPILHLDYYSHDAIEMWVEASFNPETHKPDLVPRTFQIVATGSVVDPDTHEYCGTVVMKLDQIDVGGGRAGQIPYVWHVYETIETGVERANVDEEAVVNGTPVLGGTS